MPDERTGGDALAFKHTGAGSHDAAQTDPDLCLGNHISSTLIESLTATDTTPDLGTCPMTINRVSLENGLGNGTLTAASTTTVTWTPPGASVGAAVEIANGETKLIEGADPDKFIVVTRDSANDMSSSATVAVIQVYPNAPGLDDVTDAERVAGDTEYRCIGIENMSAAEIKTVKVKLRLQGTQRTTDVAQLGASGAGTIETSGSFADWPATGWALIRESDGTVREAAYYASRTDTVLTVPAAGREALGTTAAAGAADDTVDAIPGIRLGLDAPTSQPSGTFVDNTGEDEDTAPATISFSIPGTDAEALDVGDLDTNEISGVWIEREIPAGATAAQSLLFGWEVEFDAA